MSRPLDLLFLGSGNAFAAGRYWSSFLLNGRYLFDASPIALPHLKRAAVALDDIEAVFISHFHADHFFGLPFLLLEYAEITKRTNPLTIVGPPTIEERLKTLTKVGFPHLFEKERSYEIRYVELADGATGRVGDLTFTSRAVEHVDEFGCFGFRVELDGRALAYSGDTVMCDALADLARGADVFVVECSCWEERCGTVHLGMDDIRALRKELGPTPAFVLTHLDPGERDLGIDNVQYASDLARLSF